MKEFRCSKCNKLLFKGQFNGFVQILCPRCKTMHISIQPKEVEEKHCKKVEVVL